jgi:hypothetical protein
MATGATTQLGLALPVQGELTGTWGNTVNNGITEYTNIAIAATLTLTGDGAVTLANTTGDASASNITSTLTGAGTVTAQFAIVRVTGTLTVAKVVTGPSYSKTYVIDNAATGGIVTFKAAGQTGVSVAVGEKCSVYFNGTDYVKVAGTVDTGVTSFTAGTTGLTPSTATTGAVTLAGTLAIANGGTGTTSTTFANLTTNVTGTLPTTNGGTGLTSFTSNGVVYASSTSALATGSALQFNGATLGISPSTLSPWAGNFRALQSGTGSSFIGFNGNDQTLVVSNAYNDATNWRYINSSGAGYYVIQGVSSGEHQWHSAASGTAGDTISFTQTMTLESAGNLLIGGTAERGTTVGTKHLDLFNGTAPAGTLTNGVSLYSSSGDLKFMDAAGNAYSVGYRNIPQSGSAKTSSYTLTTADVGEFIEVGASGSIVVPDATFAAGDAVVIFNNTSGAITLTMSITTAYIGGTDADKATISLATRGLCNVLFISGTVCVVTGNVT